MSRFFDQGRRYLGIGLLLAGVSFFLHPRQRPVQGAEPATPPLPPGMTLTAPHLSSELPEVLRTLHEQLSRRVVPEENAAVWLLHLYGDDALDEPLHDVTLEMLGIQTMSPESPLFVSIGDFIQSLDDVSPEKVVQEVGHLEQQLLDADVNLWTAKKFPRLAAYLKANEKGLATLVIASNCPRYFAPLLAPELPSRLMSASLVVERRLPFLVRMLAARALLRFGEQDLTGCLTDLTACHKLASLLAAGSPFDVSVAKAQVIDSIAFQAERVLLEKGHLTLAQLRDFQTALRSLPEFPPAWIAADIGERAIIHQEIELLKTDEDSRIGFFEDSDQIQVDPAQLKSLENIDWKLARKRADEIQNQIVAALKIQDRAEQLARFRELDQAYADWEASVDAKTAKFSGDLAKDRTGVSRWVGENMAMSLRPNYYQRRASEDRLKVRRGLIVTGILLEIYQRDHGEYPAALTDLGSQQLKDVPQDACTDAPFVYDRSADTRARLMSLGTNRLDDAGKNYNDDVELKLNSSPQSQ